MAAESLVYAKEILMIMKKADDKATRRIRKLLKHRTLEDIEVLETMFERVSKSSNKQLKNDFEKHNIEERLKKVASSLRCVHHHESLSNAYDKGPEYTLLECLGDKNLWIVRKRVKYAVFGVYGIFTFGFVSGIAIGATIALQHHLWEMTKKLKVVVEEIESIYDQTNSLMLANIV